MTRKDYELIAAALRSSRGRIGDDLGHNPEQSRGVRRAAAHLADALAQDNPRFDAQRFLTACGYGV